MTNPTSPCQYQANCISYKPDCPMCYLDLNKLRNTHCPAYISFEFKGKNSRFWKEERKGLLTKLLEWLK